MERTVQSAVLVSLLLCAAVAGAQPSGGSVAPASGGRWEFDLVGIEEV